LDGIARREELVSQTVRNTTTSLLALFLAGALVGPGVAQTAPASIVITDLPEWVAAGEPVSFTVTVRDAADAPMADYAGTVRFRSSSASAALPDDYTFGPDDAGSHVFTFTPRQAGALTLAVSAGPDLRAWQRTRVAPAPPASLSAGAYTPAPAPLASNGGVGPAVAAGARARLPRAGGPPPVHMYVVAHQDDDLLFMNPDVEDSIKAGARVRTVYVTAAGSPNAWQARENGILNAYAVMANVAKNWSCVPQTYVLNKTVILCTLNPQPLVSVAFMRLPDGGLASLWARDSGPPFYVTPVPTLPTADNASVYNRAQITQVLSALMLEFAPDRLGTQDSTLAYGPDHSDHIASALFALEAEHTYIRPHQLRMYRDYSVYVPWTNVPSPEAQNLSPAQHAEKVRIMEAYGGSFAVDSDFDRWCWRRYTVSRLSGGTGVLAGPDGLCVGTGGDGVTAVPCSGPVPRWTLNANGQIQDLGHAGGAAAAAAELAGERGPVAPGLYAGDPKPPYNPRVMPPFALGRCLAVDTDGTTLRLRVCTDGPAQSWTLMSNGQIRGQEGTCLTVAADGVTLRAALCEADSSTDKWKPVDTQHWVQRVGPPDAWSDEFSDGELGSPSAYAGSFRLGDVNGDGYADACARLNGGLLCALNARSGAFASHQLYSAAFSDAAGWLPDAYGSTLQIADVDGNGRADVCGRSTGGIYCATANADGTAMVNPRTWSSGTDFSDAEGWAASSARYGSIRLADVNGDGFADVCGRTSTGVVCALNDKAGRFGAYTLWIADFTDALGWQAPQYGSTLQLADVNGDGRADVCGRGPAGIRCATANAAGTAFVDAHQWSLRADFSDADGWGAGAGYYGSIRLADVNGDGLADVCGRRATGVACAISNGAAFDGALAVLPDGYTDALGWSSAPYGATIQLGDLDRDGRRDVCGRGPSGLVCAQAP
jgi:hypothetical protein